MKFYAVRHLTKFVYSHAVSESIMETRMHPRSDSSQRCLTFSLSVSPRCRVFSYRDHLGNQIQHFDIPGEHNQLVIVAESLIERQPLADLTRLHQPADWSDLDLLVRRGDFWEMLLPSEFAQPTPVLQALAARLNVTRRADPLTLVREINQSLFEYIRYVPRSTRVDSPIDEAIEAREGVCQDFAHTMIALLRHVGIPCRYVSGYLYQSESAHDRSSSGATHAWVEAFLPRLGWAGFDPANNLIASERHIRTAIGRDYADVPPTHGIFRGRTKSELHVAVKVDAFDEPPALDRDMPTPEDWSVMVEKAQEPPQQASPLFEIQQLQQQQ